MKIKFEGKYKRIPLHLIRKCGYARIVNRDGVESFVRRLSRQHYPRFHCYLENISNGFFVNLHLDQKKASYSGTTAHSGEYDGPLVEEEAARIKQIIDQEKIGNTSENNNEKEPPEYDLMQFG